MDLEWLIKVLVEQNKILPKMSPILNLGMLFWVAGRWYRHFGRPTKWVASFGRGVRLLRQSDLREPRNPQTVTSGDQNCVQNSISVQKCDRLNRSDLNAVFLVLISDLAQNFDPAQKQWG